MPCIITHIPSYKYGYIDYNCRLKQELLKRSELSSQYAPIDENRIWNQCMLYTV